MSLVIETNKLTKRYGKSRGIENVDLSIEEGETFGFIGPNGAGKSTTIRTLLGLLKPTSGSATIFGKDIMRDGPVIREDVGYLPSEVFYYDNMRVIELLRYSASFYKSKQKSDIEARMFELAKLLDLDLKKKIDNLSYGNKKKVGIIQGLQHSPQLIILDEPTGGLDPLMQQTFFDLLRQENKRGATILFSSHILSEVQKMCDRVAIIKDGTIIRVEHMDDLRKDSYVKVRLELAKPVDKKLFSIAGVRDLVVDDQHVSFFFRGDINEVMKVLSTISLVSAWVEEPELEEIFMHYYQSDQTGGD